MRCERVLILGGTGLLGPPLARALLARGYSVHAFNRGRHPERLPAGVTHWRGDRRNRDDLQVLKMVPADVLVDSAGWYPETLPEVLELFAGRTRLNVFLSSVAVYQGNGATPLTEESPTGSHPVWGEFGIYKRRCEEACRAAAVRGLPTVILRLTHLFGFTETNSREARLAGLLRSRREINVPGDGRARLQFVHFADVVNLCSRLVGGPSPASDCYNVSGERIWTISEWIAAAAGRLGVRPVMRMMPFDWQRRNQFLYWPGDLVVSVERLAAELNVRLQSPVPSPIGETCDEENRTDLSQHQ